MTSWRKIPLAEFAAEKSGSIDPAKFPDELFDLYSIPAFDSGEPEVRLGSEIGSSKQIVHPKDILLSKIVPHIRRAWVVGHKRGRRLIASGEWIVFRGERLQPDFLRYFLLGNSFHTQFMQTVSGVGGSLVRARPSEVFKITLPVPPMAEQERIVELIDAADCLRNLRAEADRRSAALIPALFSKMFGDPVVGSHGWRTEELRQLGRVVTGGTPPGTKEEMFGGDIPFITPGDLERNTREPARYLTEAGSAEVRIVRAGSTLVCCIGATIGKTDLTWKISAFNQQINAIEWGKEIEDEFGVACLKQCADVVVRQASKTALPILKKSLFERIRIPVPPLPLQKEFSERVGEIRAMESAQVASRERVESLFQSMLHRAFNGEL